MPKSSATNNQNNHVSATILNAACEDPSISPISNSGTTNRCIIAIIVYFALLLDNMLLTVIVPILPGYLEYLAETNHARMELIGSYNTIDSPLNVAYRKLDGSPTSQGILTKHPIPGKSMVNFSLYHLLDEKQTITSTKGKHITAFNESGHKFIAVPALNENSSDGTKQSFQDDIFTHENGSIGILLAMKAFIQLIFNPIVGSLSTKLGYRLIIVMGTFCLLLSSLVFAIGETYFALLLARGIHGVGSASIGVCGMSLVAEQYPEEDRRSKVMGIILGSIAVGVLLGYPFGGILYDLVGKPAPFIVLATLIFIMLGMQLVTMDLSVQPEAVIDVNKQPSMWRSLLENKMIVAIVIAIWFSTSSMAILEPCLPIFLLQNLHATNWQLGTVFIPDSLGYFIGTNFLGSVSYKYGQVKISCISLVLVGISSILIPCATTVSQLLLPHFALGLGIGTLDAALVPLLASFVDVTLANEEFDNEVHFAKISSYGTVYAIQQTSVSLAYCLAPLIGGELAEAFGFPWLMRIVGFFNLIYCPILLYVYEKYYTKIQKESYNELLLTNTRSSSQYKKLYNSLDAE